MESSIEKILQQGIAAHKAGNLQEAEDAYRTILQSQPKHPDANHNLGLLAISANQVEAALPLFKAALDTNPNIEQFWVSYISAIVKNDQPALAKQEIKKAKKLGFDVKKLNVLLSQSRGTADSTAPPQKELNSLLELYQNGRYDDAEKLATAISLEFPSHNFSWKILGAVYTATQRDSKAINAHQTAVALSPADFKAHTALGVTLQGLGKQDEAVASLTHAIALNPDYAEAHFNLGITLQELGRLDEAEASYRQTIRLKRDHAQAYSNLGITLQELGRLDEALSSYNQAILLKRDFPEAHFNFGITLQKLRKLDEAVASYRKAIALKPDYAEAHSNLGNTLRELGKLDEAEASYGQAIALKPDYAQAHCNLGNTLQELGKLNEAEAYCLQAIKLEPDLVEAYVNLGNTLRELGRLDEAESKYNEAIALKPDDSVAYSNLGITLFEKKDNVGALNCFQRSCDLTRRRTALDCRNRERLAGINKSKLTHDIEQFEYLASRSIEKEYFSKLITEYSKIRDEISWVSETGLIEIDPDFHSTLINSSRLLHLGEAHKVDRAINGCLDTNSIYDKYFSHAFGLTFIDDFLGTEALVSLREFLLESTIWYETKPGGYLGAYLNDGLASPLLLQIASELKSRFPLIIKNHPLNQIWAYKYDSGPVDLDSGLTGIKVHADFAAVNINFWITQSEANLDPDSGGMVIYNTEAPKDWSFDVYNNDLSRIRAELDQSNGGREVIPYRENRMVVFNSNLFHETDKYHFKEGYENRRINVTMLFGRREDN